MGLYIGIGIGAFILVVIIMVVIRSVYRSKLPERNEASFKTTLLSKDLTTDQIIFTTHERSRNCLSVNQANKKLSYGYIEGNQHYSKEYDFSEIISFEVQVDDQISRKVSTGGSVDGSADILDQKTKVESMFFLINVSNISDPLIKFSILALSTDKTEKDSDSLMVQNAVEQADKWTEIFKVILKENGLSAL